MRVVLPEGQYRFEGRLRLQGVRTDGDDPRGGAGLRISKGAMPVKLTGSTDWTNFAYDFAIEENPTAVELICELRATAGEAWFDRGSLHLTGRK
jgi:hypothetical protein